MGKNEDQLFDEIKSKTKCTVYVIQVNLGIATFLTLSQLT